MAASSSRWPTPPSPTPATPTTGRRWRSAAQISFIAPARQGDVLTATAREQSRAGRTGVYDVEVRQADGTIVALFRGNAYETKGAVVPRRHNRRRRTRRDVVGRS